MSETLRDQVSAFVDDELPDVECELLVRRLERDHEARRTALRYTVMGQALRGETLPGHPMDLVRRVGEALDAEGRPAASRPPVGGGFARPAGVAAMAAAVALTAIVGLRDVSPTADVATSAATAGAVAGGPAEAARALLEGGPAYTVAPSAPTMSPVTAVPNIRLTNYLVAHGEHASTLERKSIQTRIVGASRAALESEGYREVDQVDDTNR
jgi:negative regulator of sigma E activity